MIELKIKKQFWQLAGIAILGLALVACASKSLAPGQQSAIVNDSQSGTGSEESVIILPRPPKKNYVDNAAVRHIIEKARKFTEQERFGSAMQELERGVAIAPNNPLVWQSIALVRLYQGRFAQANQMARKSNALSQGDKAIMATNEQIIASAKRARVQNFQNAD